MMNPLHLTQYPDCEFVHQASNVCQFATAKTGIKMHITPPLCHYSCRAWHGPRSNTPDPQVFIRKMLGKAFGVGPRGASTKSWAEKVLRKFVIPTDIQMPDQQVMNWCNKLLADLRQRDLGVQSVCLTGSILTQQYRHNLKDLDVVVVVDSIVKRYDELMAVLPQEFGETRVDYFIMEQPSFFAASFDVETFDLYVSVEMNLASVDERINVIRAYGDWHWITEQIRDVLKEIAQRTDDMSRQSVTKHLDQMLAEDDYFPACCGAPQ